MASIIIQGDKLMKKIEEIFDTVVNAVIDFLEMLLVAIEVSVDLFLNDFLFPAIS